ncbi:MAG: zinc-binding alcohol dehydrogenase family protein [Pseudomonadota bacterium]
MTAPQPGQSRAVVLRGDRPAEDLHCFEDLELPVPALGPHDLLVRVRAVSVNPVDIKVRKRTPPTAPRVLGWDAAGVVLATGAQCTRFAPGTRVFYAGDINRPGSNQALHVVDERVVGRMPERLDFCEAAALPLTALTAWEALFERLQVQHADPAGRRVLLIIGGAGGVGSMAIQLAHCAGLRVVATASRPETQAWCRELGADAVIDHRFDLAPQLRALDLPDPQYILCCNDTDAYFEVMAQLIAPQGRICVIAGARQPQPIQALMQKSAALMWENMFAKLEHQTADLESQHHILNEVADMIDDGRLRTTLREVLGPLDARNLRLAHARVESGRTLGKLVLTL